VQRAWVIEKKIEKSSPVEFVLIALGTNDVKTKYGPPDAADVVDGIDKMVSIIKSGNSGARPILLTPPPLGNVTSGDLAGAQDRIPPVVEEYRCYATTQHIPIIDLYSVMNADTDLEPDGVHLNHSGRTKFTVMLWDNLQGVYQHVEPAGQPYR
jgi:lysophospholipase L1-like esterase